MFENLILSLGRFPFKGAKIECFTPEIFFDDEPITDEIPLNEGIPSGSKSVFKPAEFYNPRDEL